MKRTRDRLKPVSFDWQGVPIKGLESPRGRNWYVVTGASVLPPRGVPITLRSQTEGTRTAVVEELVDSPGNFGTTVRLRSPLVTARPAAEEPRCWGRRHADDVTESTAAPVMVELGNKS